MAEMWPHAWQDGYVEDTSEVIQVGQEVKARVMNIDVATGKVGLSLRTQPAPGGRGSRGPRRGEGEEEFSGDAPVRQQKFDGQRRVPARQGVILPPLCSFCSCPARSNATGMMSTCQLCFQVLEHLAATSPFWCLHIS